jgi:hypothetical protein
MANIVGDGPFEKAENVRKLFSEIPPGADPHTSKNKQIVMMNEKIINDFVTPQSLGRWYGPVLDDIDAAFVKAFHGDEQAFTHLLDLDNELYIGAFDKYTEDVLVAAKKEVARRSNARLDFSANQVPRLIYFLKRYRIPLLTKTLIVTLDTHLRQVPLVFAEVSG